MFFYSGMLIWLNRRILPEPIKIKGARLIVISITFAVFAVLSIPGLLVRQRRPDGTTVADTPRIGL